MKPENFCYWLQGFFEISEQSNQEAQLSAKQIEIIKNHLNLVFAHSIDMQATEHIKDPVEAAKKQEKYNTVHHGLLLNDSKPRC